MIFIEFETHIELKHTPVSSQKVYKWSLVRVLRCLYCLRSGKNTNLY